MVKKYPIAIFIGILAFTSSATINYFYKRGDDLSIRYILWKHNLYPYRSEFVGGVIADRHFQDQLVGKTKDEILRIFPDLRAEPVNEFQEFYARTDLVGREHLWFGDKLTVMFFENGKATYIGLMKG
ncbi:MAG TPA: hypothetical protein PKA82_14195 [Pyrinomonadaceae bacterium]|nr:hypothetical protein [Pyrinomonadaceae bacterium]